jgi:hypothetical protein
LGRPPIVVELRGRLGTQLFQFAAGTALARRHDADLFFDDARLHRGDLRLHELVGEQFRRPDDALLLRLGHRDPRRERRATRYLRSWEAQGRARVTRRAVQLHEHTPHRYDPAVVAAAPPYLLRGYLQSELYFADVADEVAAAIRLPGTPPPGPGPTVAVSYRRGDYVGQPYLLPPAYQERALERLCREVQPGTILVFGDDQEFAELVVPRLERFGRVRASTTRDPVSALAEMAACDHFVVPNSSFAWWAAWLGERRPEPERHVVLAPEGWMTRGHPEDTIPDRWEQVGWE